MASHGIEPPTSQPTAGREIDKADTHLLSRNQSPKTCKVDLERLPRLAPVHCNRSGNSNFFKIKLKLIFKYLQNLSGLGPKHKSSIRRK